MKYRVTQGYRATTGDQHYAFAKGSAVELPDDVAEWVNRDCPGLLVEIKPEPVERAQQKRKTRQVVKADNREGK